MRMRCGESTQKVYGEYTYDTRGKAGESMQKENPPADEKRRRAEKERERRENLRSWATLAAVTVTAIINTAAIILQLTR